MSKKRVQRLKNFRVTKVAILDVPSAVGAKGVYKAAAGADMVLLKAVTKYEENAERGLLYSLVMVPDRVDKHGHWATSADIEEACHSWGEEGCPMNFNHGPEFGEKINGRDLAKSEAVVVENTIVQTGDPRFQGITIDGETVDPTGGWGVVIKLKSEELRKLAREKKLNELSLESPSGSYELVTEEPPKEEELSMADINSLEQRLEKMETGMATVVSSVEALTKALPKPQTPEQKEIAELKEKLAKLESKPADTPPADTPPADTVDLNDPEALKKMERDMERAELREGIDLKKAADIKKYREDLAKLEKRYAEEDAAEQKSKGKPGEGIQKSEDSNGDPSSPHTSVDVSDMVKALNARRGVKQPA